MNLIEIDENSYTFLKLIEDYPHTPFQFSPLNWDRAMMASTARDLHNQQLLLLYRP